MERRLVEQVKVYSLIMNPVTDRAESSRIAVMSFDKNNLITFYNNQITDSYNDETYNKVFKKSGPLEWYNPLWTLDGLDSFGHGLREDWIDATNIEYVKSKYYFI
jgi:hypothetical protein